MNYIYYFNLSCKYIPNKLQIILAWLLRKEYELKLRIIINYLILSNNYNLIFTKF